MTDNQCTGIMAAILLASREHDLDDENTLMITLCVEDAEKIISVVLAGDDEYEHPGEVPK